MQKRCELILLYAILEAKLDNETIINQRVKINIPKLMKYVGVQSLVIREWGMNNE